MLIAPDAALGPADGALLGLKGVAAALIGGLASLRLAMVGGLVLGVLEAFAVTELGGGWGDVVALALLVVWRRADDRDAHRRPDRSGRPRAMRRRRAPAAAPPRAAPALPRGGPA